FKKIKKEDQRASLFCANSYCFARTTKAIKMPPKIAPEITEAPTTPFALRYGVPEPSPGCAFTISTFFFASSSSCSKVIGPLGYPEYCCANASCGKTADKSTASNMLYASFFIVYHNTILDLAFDENR